MIPRHLTDAQLPSIIYWAWVFVCASVANWVQNVFIIFYIFKKAKPSENEWRTRCVKRNNKPNLNSQAISNDDEKSVKWNELKMEWKMHTRTQTQARTRFNWRAYIDGFCAPSKRSETEWCGARERVVARSRIFLRIFKWVLRNGEILCIN